MSDQTKIVELAIAAAGQVGSNERAWHHRVMRNTALVAAMFRPPAPGHEEDATSPLVTARKMAEASVFAADFVGFRLDENMKRVFVSVRSKTGSDSELEADGTEELRTEPWWTDAGYLMRKAIEALEPGTPLHIYKYNEPIEGGRKNTRVLVHFQVVGKPRPADDAAPPQRASQAERPAGQAPPATPAPPPPAPSGDEFENSDYLDRVNALSTPQKVAFRRMCQTNGVANFAAPGIDELDKALVFLAQIEQQGAS